MIFKTMGNKKNPAILYLHAMGVTGDSSVPVAEFLKDDYYCIMPTSTVYCEGQKYLGKAQEVKEILEFLKSEGVEKIELLVASSIGADLAMELINTAKIQPKHIFFDGGQFAQIKASVRHIMTPFMYLAIKSLYWSKGKTLKYILWCDDDNIKPYFIKAGKSLTYGNLYRQLSDSLIDDAFPKLSEDLQKRTFWEFGTDEDHFKYRNNVMKSYKFGNFPIFEGYNHMQFQIKNPKGFADMLVYIIENGEMPNLPFCK